MRKIDEMKSDPQFDIHWRGKTKSGIVVDLFFDMPAGAVAFANGEEVKESGEIEDPEKQSCGHSISQIATLPHGGTFCRVCDQKEVRGILDEEKTE